MNSLKRRSDFTILLRVSLMLTTLLFSIGIKAQTDYPKVNFNYFGHVQIDLEMIENLQKNGTFNHASYANLGEQDLFVNAQINKRISFLGETVVRPDLKSSSFFIPSIERAQLKFDYFRNHSFLIGKFHTPVNFWNDTYHHGRLFFPVIDRPVMFSYLIPLHTLGVRLQGQNLGALRFGYDMVLGNGISSNDTKDLDMHKSITLAAHIKPRDGVHSGHIGASHVAQSSSYKGDIRFQLLSFSTAWFSNRFELLHELSLNRTKSDSLGIAGNWSSFIYAGYRINNLVPFVVFDYLDISEKDLHIKSLVSARIAIGARYEFTPYCNIKILAEHLRSEELFPLPRHNHPVSPDIYELKIQLAYGF
jgi:hypothetical protein